MLTGPEVFIEFEAWKEELFAEAYPLGKEGRFVLPSITPSLDLLRFACDACAVR
jgi:hypothetical protein